jgi:uncharacterized membrane-anchored protein
MTLKGGHLIATMTAQVIARRYHPLSYWLVVVATTTVGTTTSDFIDRTLHLGYVLSSAMLLGLVILLLIVWRLTTGHIAAGRITNRTDEVFYWLTILVSNTLGTALGDFTSETIPDLMDKIAHAPLGGWGPWGFELGAVLFAGLTGLVAVLHLLKALPLPILFWATYILTRPLGATLGDTLTKPRAQGGLEFGRLTANATIVLAMVVLVLLSPKLRRPASVPAGAN